MDNFKIFQTEADYQAYLTGGTYIKPNVSYITEDDKVHYNYPPAEVPYVEVDLGLSSGTKWCNKNVGAESIYDAGLYFQWADVQGYTADQIGTGEGQKQFVSADYKYYDNDYPNKYYNVGDVISDLGTDDAAFVNIGSEWQMPTPAQIDELIALPNAYVLNDNGVGGRLFVGYNGNKLFIPFGGDVKNGEIRNADTSVHFWSNTIGGRTDSQHMFNDNKHAWRLYASNSNKGTEAEPSVFRYENDRPTGMNIRAVKR